MFLARIAVSMYDYWSNGMIAISDDRENWTIISPTLDPEDPDYNPELRSSSIAFEPQWARYILLGSYGLDGNKMQELQVFAVNPIPEPVTMSLLTLGGLALLRRRR